MYEVKRGGDRTIIVKDGRKVALFAEDGEPLDYPEIQEAVRNIRSETAVIDGELIAFDSHGHSSAKKMERLSRDSNVRLCAFDLLHTNGRDLTKLSLEHRKAQLCTATLDSMVLFSPSLDCEPDPLVDEVRRLSLEAVIAKRKGSTYESGQCTGAWVEMRAHRLRTRLAAAKRSTQALISV